VCICVAPVVKEDAAARDPVESPVVDAAAVVAGGTDYVAAFCLFSLPFLVLFLFLGGGLDGLLRTTNPVVECLCGDV
jgi:hypothetical protein